MADENEGRRQVRIVKRCVQFSRNVCTVARNRPFIRKSVTGTIIRNRSCELADARLDSDPVLKRPAGAGFENHRLISAAGNQHAEFWTAGVDPHECLMLCRQINGNGTYYSGDHSQQPVHKRCRAFASEEGARPIRASGMASNASRISRPSNRCVSHGSQPKKLISTRLNKPSAHNRKMSAIRQTVAHNQKKTYLRARPGEISRQVHAARKNLAMTARAVMSVSHESGRSGSARYQALIVAS